MKTAIILGSSRSHGNTAALAKFVCAEVKAEYFDLANYHIAPFSYDNDYQDDFSRLVDQLWQFDRLILATPMYWYSASAQMKVFLDRLSDLLSFDKDKGRALRGKSAALLATGVNPIPADCFEQMFALTFHYLGMGYQGMKYCVCPSSFELSDHKQAIQAFIADRLSTGK